MDAVTILVRLIFLYRPVIATNLGAGNVAKKKGPGKTPGPNSFRLCWLQREDEDGVHELNVLQFRIVAPVTTGHVTANHNGDILLAVH